MFESHPVRSYFLQSLNKLRSTNGEMSREAMESLILMFIAFLNAVYIQGDIRAAKLALILSETFYSLDEQGKRVYAQESVKEHGIWRSEHFWEETFFLAVRNEVISNVVQSSSSSGPASLSSSTSTLPDLKNPRHRTLAASSLANITFGQLSSSAFSMASLGLDRALIQSFVRRMAASLSLSHDQCNTLLLGLGFL